MPEEVKSAGKDNPPSHHARWTGAGDTDSLAGSLLMAAFAVTNDPGSARQSVLEALADGLKSAREKNERPEIRWLFKQTVKKSRVASRSVSPAERSALHYQEYEKRIWDYLDKLGWRERLLCVVHYGLGWPDARAAELLDASVSAVQAQIAIIEQHMRKVLAGNASTSAPGADSILELSAAIKRHFSIGDAEINEIEDLLEQIEGYNIPVAQTASARSKLPWPLIGGAGLLVLSVCLVITFIFIVKPFFSRQELSSTPFQPTTSNRNPFSQMSGSLPLTWLSRPEVIWERMQNSSQLWQTIFIETQITDYGPASYIGAPRQYHLLAWVKQPDESIQLFGLLSQNPSQINVLTNGHSFELNPILNQSSSQVPQGKPETLLENETVRKMVFPGTTSWSPQQGVLRVYNTERLLGRETLCVDWYDRFGQHRARFWLDVRIGTILRLQEYGGPDSNMVLRDTIATQIIFNQSFPPAYLAGEMQKVSSTITSKPTGGAYVILPTATPAIPFSQRQSLTVETLPNRYNLPASVLMFQFANNLETSNTMTNTARVPAQIFADRYLAVTTRFGLPWMLRCQRSPDGFRLAFNTGSDGASTPDDSLLWLDLRYPEQVYEPFPELHAEAFAFSPDSTRIAVFGYGAKGEGRGIYLIDLSKVDTRKVIDLYEAHSLVWSPDGESLAILGKFEEDISQEAAVIHIRTGQISFRAPSPEGLRRIPESWPMSNWGVPFPQLTGGMDECSKPVQ